MFFSMEPDKFFPYTQIDVVQFPDGLGRDMPKGMNLRFKSYGL